MIEAVNSVLSNASSSRSVVEQQATTRSYAANPEKTQEAATKTPYVSPYISIDRNYNKAVLQIRDSDTGDVIRQFPTEGQLKAYRTAQQFSERQKAQAESQLKQANGASQVSSSSSQVEVSTTPDVAVDTSSVATAQTETSGFSGTEA